MHISPVSWRNNFIKWPIFSRRLLKEALLGNRFACLAAKTSKVAQQKLLYLSIISLPQSGWKWSHNGVDKKKSKLQSCCYENRGLEDTKKQAKRGGPLLLLQQISPSVSATVWILYFACDPKNSSSMFRAARKKNPKKFILCRSKRSIAPNEGFIEQLIELNDRVHHLHLSRSWH